MDQTTLIQYQSILDVLLGPGGGQSVVSSSSGSLNTSGENEGEWSEDESDEEVLDDSDDEVS